MKNKRLLVWYIMLNKRLLKKWSFIIVLLVAPLMVFVMNTLSGGDKGVLRILLCEEAESQAVSQIITELQEGDSVIMYEKADSLSQARHMVESGDADAAWVFATVIEDTLPKAAMSHRVKPVVNVIEREDTIALMMARERLYSVIYPYLNYEIYVDYIRKDIAQDSNISDEELHEYYESNKAEDELFQRKYLDGKKVAKNMDYLLAPVRGILAVWLALCGLVSCLYYMIDKNNGIFDRLSIRYDILAEAGYHMVIIVIAAILMFAGLMVSGTFTSPAGELVSMLALIYVTTGYCCLIRRLCRTPGVLGIAIPFLVIMMLGLSSAFISLKVFSYFKYLHPVYLYIMSIHSVHALVEMIVFGTVLFILCYFIKCSHFTHKNKI